MMVSVTGPLPLGSACAAVLYSWPKTTSIGTWPVTCRARLGGVLKFYDREAA